MSYELHIERLEMKPDGAPLPLTTREWREAVGATEGVRFNEPGEHIVVNPQTGDRIRIPRSRDDVEVFFPGDRQWYPVFRWHNGSASFAAGAVPDDDSDPVWIAAVALARHLGAAIRGDEGEYYYPTNTAK